MAATDAHVAAAVEDVAVSAYEIPTDAPESDGTLAWDSTTLVVVEIAAAGSTGIGYTYAPAAAGRLIDERLKHLLPGVNALAVGAVWEKLGGALRNAGRPGLGSSALAAVDIALWDLKARLLELPLVTVLDAVRDAVPVYGSGGFTSYSLERLGEQLAGWVEQGIPRVKMKVGRRPDEDPARLEAVRQTIGDETELYVDANGAFERKQALYWAERLAAEWRVTWFEEPVSSTDFEGLRLLRDRAPAGMDVAAGEYGYVIADFRNLLAAGAVDVLQADVTRCGGFTGFLRVAALADAAAIPLSGHTAPQLHAHAGCAVARLRHVEYFHDHARIERMLFDGTIEPVGGALRPDLSRPGHGLELRRPDAEPFLVYESAR